MTEHPSDPRRKPDAAAIREALAGYALANEVIEAERQAMLARMSTEDALVAWRDLMKGFNGRPEMRRNAEDLIIHKAIAGRPQDVRDVEGIERPWRRIH